MFIGPLETAYAAHGDAEKRHYRDPINLRVTLCGRDATRDHDPEYAHTSRFCAACRRRRHAQ
jgi:hypothetical protein